MDRDLRSEIRAGVDRIVTAHDPEGLLAAGCPADEYGPEVEELTDLVLHGAVDIASVRALWERWFGPDSGPVRTGAGFDRLTAALTDLPTTGPR